MLLTMKKKYFVSFQYLSERDKLQRPAVFMPFVYFSNIVSVACKNALYVFFFFYTFWLLSEEELLCVRSAFEIAMICESSIPLMRNFSNRLSLLFTRSLFLFPYIFSFLDHKKGSIETIFVETKSSIYKSNSYCPAKIEIWKKMIKTSNSFNSLFKMKENLKVLFESIDSIKYIFTLVDSLIKWYNVF